MKKLFLITAMAALAFGAHAQDVKFGPRVGLNSSTLKVDKNSTSSSVNAQIESGDAKFGFQAGLFARLGIVGFYLQPEALFSSSGGEIHVQSTATSSTIFNETRELNFKRIDVPVLFGKKFGGVFRINAGPSFTYLLKAESTVGNTTVDIKENYKDATVGYQAGIGVDLGPLILDLKYEGNLSKFGDQVQAGGTSVNTDQRQSMWVFAVGFSFL